MRALLLIAIGCGQSAASPPRGPVITEPCKLFTSAEVSAALGIRVGEGALMGQTCSWDEQGVAAAGRAHELDVEIHVERAAADVARELADRRQRLAHDPHARLVETDSRIGDDAFFEESADSLILHVGAGAIHYEIEYASADDDPDLDGARGRLFTLAAKKI